MNTLREELSKLLSD
jgi:hypothetical protein